MKLTFMKLQHVRKNNNGYTVEIAPGCIRYSFKQQEIALAERLKLDITLDGRILNVLRKVKLEVFEGLEIDSREFNESLYGIITQRDFEKRLHKELKKHGITFEKGKL